MEGPVTTKATRYRLFLAVYPDLIVRRRLEEFVGQWRRDYRSPAFRWLSPEQWHITIEFFGNVVSESVPELLDAVRSSIKDAHGFPVEARGVGVFPSARSPRVFWAGLSTGAGELKSLYDRIAPGLRRFVEKPSNRGFHPHLTLAYVKAKLKSELVPVRKLLTAATSVEFGKWHADGVDLVRSELSPQGARHTVMERFAIAGR